MLTTIAHIEILPTSVVLCDQPLAVSTQGADMLSELYRQHVGDYPKFFKMDGLCRLGFVASELLLNAVAGEERFIERADRGVLLFGHAGSADADERYQQTVNSFPSPSVFVYTLPNIITGEIAIRNHYLGETSFCLAESYDSPVVQQTVQATLLDPETTSLLTGWVDYRDANNFEARLSVCKKI